MIERLIAWSLRNRAVTLLVATGGALLGVFALARTPVDAIPDLSENQVIVHAAWPGRSPREVEDQVTRPLSAALRGTAGVRALRASSEFGFAMIDLVFEDGVDFRSARSQILERLASLGDLLPAGVTPAMAPDATALGQIFWYTVEFHGDRGGYDLGALRAIQEVHVGPALAAVAGVAEVAAVGGLPREWQVDLDPERLQSHGVALDQVVLALSHAQGAVGAGVVQKANAEFVVRGTSEFRGRDDLESVVVADHAGIPVRVRDVGTVQLGGGTRRSVLEKDGREAVGGVVLMRHGENPLAVTRAVHAKIREISPGLPPGIRIVPFYERTRLIESALSHLARTVTVEMLIAAGVVLLVMRHLGASLVVCTTLPLSVLGSFVLMHAFSVPTNLMSLAGIAVSIGVLVDQAVVLSDNAMHRLRERFGDAPVRGDLREFLVGPCQEVGRPVFFALLVMVVSFLPVFALSGIEGKMFHPFAWTKTFVLLGAALLTVTLVPALLPLVLRGRMQADDSSALVRSVVSVYRPLLAWLMERHCLVVLLFTAILACGWVVASRLGREFLPPLDEGSILDMPITVPRVSVTQAGDDLRARDEILRGFPEVESVVGKAGRADTATDPSPIDMVETVVNLRPREAWPRRHLPDGDAAEALRHAFAGLHAAGVLAGVSENAAEALLENATGPLRERLDEELRSVARRSQVEALPRIAEELARTLVEETLEFLRGAGRVQVEPEPQVLDASVAAIVERYGDHLAQGPLPVDVQRAALAAAEALVHAGVAEARSDLLVDRQGSLLGPVDAVRAAFTGAEAPDLFGRIHDRLVDRHEGLWEGHAAALRPALAAHAEGALPRLAVEAVLDAARERGALDREATPEERRAAEGRVAAGGVPRLVAKSKADLVQEMDAVLRVPGWANIWTQPIVNRIDMLTTGIRTTVGVKVLGDDLATVQAVANHVAEVLRGVPGAADVFADQAVGKGYVEVAVDRDRAGLVGVSPRQVLDAVEAAVGGRAVAEVVHGRERVPVRVRYARSARVDEESLRGVLVGTPLSAVTGSDRGAAAARAPAAMAMSGSTSGHAMGGSRPKSATVAAPRREVAANADWSPPPQIALGDVATVRVVEGPSMIRSEDGRLCAYVQMNVRGRDVVGFVEEARRTVERFVDPPEGVTLGWSGQYEHQVRARRTLTLVVPAVLLLILAILFVTYRDLLHAGLVMLAVPGALAGGVFCQALLGFDFSVTAWVGYIACFGMATETGIVMLVYLREAVARAGGVAGIPSIEALRAAVLEGAVRRMRPKLLTEGTTVLAIAPLLFADGVGAEVLRPMAAPVLGGILIADEVIDVFLPVLFYRLERWRWERRRRHTEGRSAA